MKKLVYILTILMLLTLVIGVCACNNDKYTVSYYDGNEMIGTRNVDKGGEIPNLTASKTGYRFDGWYLQDGTGIQGVTVENDLSVYARWSKLYTVELNYGKGIALQTLEAVAGENVTLPEAIKTSDGKEMIRCWTDGATEYEPNSVFVMPALNLTLSAEWGQTLIITYLYNGQEVTVETAKGAKLQLMDGVNSTTGSPIYSWSDGDNSFRAGDKITVTQNMTLTAMWAGSYTVSYDADGGEEIASQTKYTGEEIILPLPAKTGYNFLGWQIGDTVFSAGAIFTVGAENVTLKALWEIITFEVTFTDWDGYPFEVVVVEYGNDVIFPQVPVTMLAEFVGWSADGKNILEDTTITAIYNYQIPVNASLYNFTPVDGGYSISAGNATLLTGTEIVLPASYRGQKVVAVADSSSSTTASLKGFESVTSITLTSPYEKLGARAFRSFANLTTVTLNANLKSIGNDCFYCCYKLSNLQLNEGLLSIGSRAFYDIGVSDYVIPSSVTSIGDLAFFYYPASQLDPTTCYKSITVAQGNSAYASQNGVLYNSDFTKLVCYPANKEGASFTLPSTVTALGTYCFSYAKNITNFSFGDSRVTSIERLAFNSTAFDIVLPDSLTEITKDMLELAYGDVTLSNTIKVIPSNAFSSFYGKNVYIPATVEVVEEYAFYHCPGVENVYFADGCRVEIIEDYAFADCEKLKTVNLHEGLKEIGAFAFSVVKAGVNQNQIESITFPASLEKIGDYAFSYCKELTTVNFANGSFISEISTGAFGSCAKLDAVSFGNSNPNIELVFGLRAFALCAKLTNFNFPKNLVSIGDECFAGSESQEFDYTSNKIKDVVLPASVKIIGNGAFSVCKSLVTFTVESGSVLETIGDKVFFNCFNLTKVALSENLKNMGDNVFAGCEELTDVQLVSMSYEYVDGGLYNKETDTLEFAKVGADGVFTVQEGTVTIVDSCFANSSKLKVINIASTVKTIGNRAFYKCIDLEEVNIPQDSQLESIGDYAFAGPPDNSRMLPFTEIYLPPTLKSIGSNAFFYTAISTPLYFSAELTTLGGYAFAYCNKLPSVTFAENSKLTTIGASAFYGCKALTSVIFGAGSSLESMGSIVFNGCIELQTVVLTSKQVVTLGTNVFGNTPTTMSIYVDDSLLTSYINGAGWGNYVSSLKPISQYK